LAFRDGIHPRPKGAGLSAAFSVKQGDADALRVAVYRHQSCWIELIETINNI
jgi:hypothetical protein